MKYIYDPIVLSLINISDPIYNNTLNLYESNLSYNSTVFTIDIDNIKIKDIRDTILILEFSKSNNNAYELLYKFDKAIIQSIHESSDRLFGKHSQYNIIDDLYKNTLNIPTSLYEMPTINITLSDMCKNIILSAGNYVNIKLCPNKILFEKNKCTLQYVITFISLSHDITECAIDDASTSSSSDDIMMSVIDNY